MIVSAVEIVARAIAAAKKRGDDDLVRRIRIDINVYFLTFDEIVQKYRMSN